MSSVWMLLAGQHSRWKQLCLVLLLAAWIIIMRIFLLRFQDQFRTASDLHDYFSQVKSLNSRSHNITPSRSKTQRKLVPISLQDLFLEGEKWLRESSTRQTLQHNPNTIKEKPLDSPPVNQSEVAPLEPSCHSGVLLLAMIVTRVTAFERRQAIRLSWGNPRNKVNQELLLDSGHTWQTVFLVGRSSIHIENIAIELEHRKYRDILRGSNHEEEDTYENLPKKILSGMAWLSKNCVPKYLLKSDDDVFVNIFQLLPWISTLSPAVVYAGKGHWTMPVIRDPKHRNFVSRQDHPDDVYKPYCAGGAYILAGNILKNVTAASPKVRPIRNEDARMGMIINTLGLKPHDDRRFLPSFGKPMSSLGVCDWKDKFVIHGVSPRKQLVMHWNSVAMLHLPTLCEKL